MADEQLCSPLLGSAEQREAGNLQEDMPGFILFHIQNQSHWKKISGIWEILAK